MSDWLAVVAGFPGSVLAERLATVLKINRRSHVGGNGFDWDDEAGVHIPRYGPHIFHTNAEALVTYLWRFSDWRRSERRVLADVDGELVPSPTNLDTNNRRYGPDLTSRQREPFLAARSESVDEVRTAEDVAVGTVGRAFYEKFFFRYTRKQWGVAAPSQLSKSVTPQVLTGTNMDDRFFADPFQSMPPGGYPDMFQRMLAHSNIKVTLQTHFREIRNLIPHRGLVYTHPIHEFLDFRLHCQTGLCVSTTSRLTSRSSSRRRWCIPRPSPLPGSRKHMTGQQRPETSLTYKYLTSEGGPYYPAPRPKNEAPYKRYEALAPQEPDAAFVIRLATYNIGQLTGQTLGIQSGPGGGRAVRCGRQGRGEIE